MLGAVVYWEAQKPSSVVEGIAEPEMAAGLRDDIEQIAVLPGLSIGPFACGATTVRRRGETNIKTAARRIASISDQPVAAFSPSGGKIVATYRLSSRGEAA
jgi:hypothetical protein